MEENEVVKTDYSVQKFMDLFLLKQMQEEGISEKVLLNNESEAIQIALEPNVYEDVPMIKNVQNHIIDLAIKREKQGRQQCDFKKEIEHYVGDMYEEKTSFIFSQEEIQNKWNSYTDVEKERMGDFIDSYYDILNYVEEKSNYFEQGKRK